MDAIVLQGLSKTYMNGKRAVNRISFSLKQGEVFGFLGPNGAGKTTTVKLLTGMLAPSEGEIRILGLNPAEAPKKVHAVSGVVTEHAQMYNNMTGKQNLIFYGSVFGMAKAEADKRAAFLLKQLELDEAGDQKLSTYSTGMRQRLSLARALIHRPQILFLDEPTSGLDPESAQNVNQLIRKLAEDDHITIFLCTHQLRYAQEICTRYGLMAQGRLLATGTLDELRNKVASGISLEICGDHMPEELGFLRTGERQYESRIRSDKEIPDLVRKIVTGGGDIYSVNVKKTVPGGYLFFPYCQRGGTAMKQKMAAIIRKDLRNITANKNLFLSLLIVPLVFTIIFPSILVCAIHFMPDDPDIQKMLELLPMSLRSGNMELDLMGMILNYILPVFFLIIPVMAASIMSASAFVGEKEKHTLETLLYCPLSVKQIFCAKVMASFFLSMLISFISFLAMLLVLEAETLFLMGSFLLPGISWFVILFLISPSVSLIAITLIVRGSAKAQSVEESQQGAVFLVIPLLLLAVGQFMGVLLVNTWILLGLGALCALAAGLLLKRSMGRFSYEMLLK